MRVGPHELRPYQVEFVETVASDFREHNRLLAVAATGSGKTLMAGALSYKRPGRTLFCADARQLVEQTVSAFRKIGVKTGVEMGEYQADIEESKVVVGTVQSISRRLDKYPRHFFDLLVFDEAHRNSLGEMASNVMSHFQLAQVLGLTATPSRSDRRQLGELYEKISIEVGLFRLIKEGFLSRIRIKSVPSGVSLQRVRTIGGDYNDADLGKALAPHLQALAQLVYDHAPFRKTVVFLPLIETSTAFVAACTGLGMRAVHVDGKDREGLERFTDGEYDIISNASLLTTGWDCPEIDCVLPARPTKSLSLYQQMVGRGTRISPGKRDLLVLDPLFLADQHNVISAAQLIAKTPEQAQALHQRINEAGDEVDLMEEDEQVAQIRRSQLEKALEMKARKKGRSVDAMDFCLRVAEDLTDYEPELKWEKANPSAKQLATLQKFGIDPQTITSRGQASKILDVLFTRRKLDLASIKQVRMLERYGYENPNTATFVEARNFLDTVAQAGWRKKAS